MSLYSTLRAFTCSALIVLLHLGCDEKTRLFRKVTDAYECLSCEQSRRSYDSSLGVSTVVMPSATTSARASKIYAPSKPPPGGVIYDFAEWQRQHYGDGPAPQQNMRRESSADRNYLMQSAKNTMDQRSSAIRRLHLRREQRRAGNVEKPGCTIQ